MGWKANWAEISPFGLGPTGPGGGSPENPPWFSGCGLTLLDGPSYLNAGLLMRPNGPDGSYGPASADGPTAQRPFLFPQPRNTGSRPPLPQRSPCLAAPSPARASAAAHRVETWTRRWGAPRPHHSLPALTHARAARRPASSLLATARGATLSPGARVYPARRNPGHAGVRPVGFLVHAHLQDPLPHTELGVERPHTEFHWRRGHGHGALGCGRPAPALTSSCNRTTHGSKAGSQQRVSSPPATRRPETRCGGRTIQFTGLAARRASGAAHDGAAHNDAARGVPQPYLQKQQDPKTATALGRHGLG
jgi:hypothetical protein